MPKSIEVITTLGGNAMILDGVQVGWLYQTHNDRWMYQMGYSFSEPFDNKEECIKDAELNCQSILSQ